MKRLRFLTLITVALLNPILCNSQQGQDIIHTKVYFEKGRFGGWPANHGIWIWENEILVGFGRGYYKDLGIERHNIDREKPEEHYLARSLNGGETWTIEDPSKDGILVARGNALHGTEPNPENLKPITQLSKPMDFSKHGFVLKFWMLDGNIGPSIFYYSYDKGHTWKGPFSLAVGNLTKISARNDYIIEDRNSCIAFLTVAKSNDREGRVLVARTDDGGISWQFVSWVGEEPENGFRIMPSTLKIAKNKLLLTSRVREDTRNIDSWISNNNGKSWDFAGKPVKELGEGNPPSLIKLKDGTLCLTYGYRAEPFSICAKLSKDNGKTWGKQIVLRDDGAGRDIGYVRSVQRPDGKVVTIYYFQDKANPERYIGCTIWDPKKY
jgi:hypothetical protein